MRTQRKQFKSKLDGYGRAKRVWSCQSCQTWHIATKPSLCTSCGGGKFYYFASQAEAKRYAELLLLKRAGEITNLETQVKFPLVVNGVKIFERGYYADFMYTRDGKKIVEDVKAKSDEALSDIFKAKRNLVGALYGIQVDIIKRS